jgi:hypothetical protein
MKPTSRRIAGCTAGAAGTVLATFLLTGCDVGEVLGADEAEDEPSISEPSDSAEVEGALAIGDTFDGEASTTVESIIRGEGDETWLEAGDNFEWLSPTVRTCVSAVRPTTEVGWYQWAATGADGSWYPADLDYDDAQPADQYPRLTDLAPGECAEGRILIAVPSEAEVVALINSDQSGTPQGSWLVGDVGIPEATDGD